MSQVRVNEEILTLMADAIREKVGITDELTLNEMIAQIENIILGAPIDDERYRSDATWSSSKINSSLTQIVNNSQVNAAFTSSGGYKGLRYYNNQFQYKNAAGSWISLLPTTADNRYILNIKPNPMRYFAAHVDFENGIIKLKWTEPEDTFLSGQCVVTVDRVVLVRKKGSFPEDVNDGKTIVTVLRDNFFDNDKDWFIDEDDFEEDQEYYYKWFVYSDEGLCNNTGSLNERKVVFTKHVIYGIEINSDSDPEKKVTYLEDCVGFKPARMDYDKDEFDYGDWEDSFFMKKIKGVVLNQYGEEVYQLKDMNPYLSEDEQDLTEESSNPNLYWMVKFPLVWIKSTLSPKANYPRFYFSDYQVDSEYKCYPFVNKYDEILPYFYLSMFPVGSGYTTNNSNTYNSQLIGNLDNNDRINGGALVYNQSFYVFFNRIKELYEEYPEINEGIWQPHSFVTDKYISLLLLLISKTTNSQLAFGYGFHGSVFNSNNGGICSPLFYLNTYIPSLKNKNGLFYGLKNQGGLKTFGLYGWWGYEQARYIAGVSTTTTTATTAQANSIYACVKFGLGTVDENLNIIEYSDMIAKNASNQYISYNKTITNNYKTPKLIYYYDWANVHSQKIKKNSCTVTYFVGGIDGISKPATIGNVLDYGFRMSYVSGASSSQYCGGDVGMIYAESSTTNDTYKIPLIMCSGLGHNNGLSHEKCGLFTYSLLSTIKNSKFEKVSFRLCCYPRLSQFSENEQPPQVNNNNE